LLQLQALWDFDAAFWGTGQLEEQLFHAVSQMGLDEHYGQRLIDTLPLNPISQQILANLDCPVPMSQAYADEAFYQSELYRKLFVPYGIERILATGHYDERSGLYTLISFYRKQREPDFTAEERARAMRLVCHLVGAASHAFFLHLQVRHPGSCDHAAAICDRQGYFHEVQEECLDLLDRHCPDRPRNRLPFQPAAMGERGEFAGLSVKVESLGDLILVQFRQMSPLDRLTDREREIVHWITRGLSFKEVGRQLQLAPSTVANHLYRIYHKLEVSSRTELAQLTLAQSLVANPQT
jgi:DNA-binding CsgD family transcriptional regulator